MYLQTLDWHHESIDDEEDKPIPDFVAQNGKVYVSLELVKAVLKSEPEEQHLMLSDIYNKLLKELGKWQIESK